VAPSGYGAFCGWAVDGNERFLLADFTVTHNSRIAGGQDATSPRYIHTTLTLLVRKLYRTEDQPVLAYRYDDGVRIEPEFYVPVLPTVLMNGVLGIGTGFSTNLPCFDPGQIAGACERLIAAIDASGAEMDDSDTIKAVIDAVDIPLFHPWYAGFEGSIAPLKPGSYQSTGVWKWVNDATVEVSELPVGTWTDNYKAFLTGLVDDGSKTLRDFEGRYTERSPHFVLRMHAGARSAVERTFATEFKQASMKNLGMNNAHLYTAAGAIRKFANVAEILREWGKTRVDAYLARKRHQIETTEQTLAVVSAKVRFIQDIIEGRVVVNNAKQADVAARLAEARYPTFNEESGGEGYAYLTRMPIFHLTYEKKRALEDEARGMEAGLAELRSTAIHRVWAREIREFVSAWDEHRQAKGSPM
jgi:DNA topoisomerase II